MTIVTMKELATAIANELNIGQEEAERYARIVIDFFGFDDRIIDNVLTQEERRLFYRLQERGVISSEREENKLPNGNPWRTHYWILKKTFILQSIQHATKGGRATELKRKPAARSLYEQIYSNVPTDLWATRKLSHT